ALAEYALDPDPLVLAAVALPVPGRTEDLLAEEPVLFRLERAVVDGFGLLDLTVRPLPDVVGGSKANAQVVEEVDVKHVCYPLGSSSVLQFFRPLQRCSAHAGTGRCRVPRRRGTHPRRCHASRSPRRRWRAPPR